MPSEEKAPAGLELRLPQELQMRLFTYLSLKDLLLYAAPVCKAWREMVSDPLLWKKLSFTGTAVLRSRVESILTQSVLLRELGLDCRKDLQDLLPVLAAHCPQLQVLRLSWSGMLKAQDLSAVAVGCPLLQQLKLAGVTLQKGDSYLPICGMQALQSLTLWCTWEPEDWKCLLKVSKDCPYLTHLELGFFKTTTEKEDEAVKAVLQEVGGRLRHLAIKGETMHEPFFKVLGSCCGRGNLRVLEMFASQGMTDEGLLQGVGRLRGLRHLVLKWATVLTSQALATFLSWSVALGSLHHLDLSLCTNLDDECLRVLSCTCPLLEHLDLGGCRKVSERGLKCLVRGCSKLRYLKLYGITDITGESFALMPTHTPHLQELYLLKRAVISPQVIRDLQENMPALCIKQLVV